MLLIERRLVLKRFRLEQTPKTQKYTKQEINNREEISLKSSSKLTDLKVLQ